MKLNLKALNEREAWEKIGIALPKYDIAAMVAKTKTAPAWVHFGAGNIFRGFIAGLQQRLLNGGLAEKGITAAETFDYDIIDRIYAPFDNLALNVIMNPDATLDCEVTASVAEAVKASDKKRLEEIFAGPELQMVSFTITEKGYALNGADGGPLPMVKSDMENGPRNARHVMAVLTALLLCRYRAGGYPLAVVSMDNCSGNGDILKGSVMRIAEAWKSGGFADGGFVGWLEEKISFPWSMIDKITPRPAKSVEDALAEKGMEDMTPVITGKGVHIAPFVNAERPQYLVIEDDFPNGRPALEKAGVYMTDRETVNKVERMKVTACLNPLHTAMGFYGSLLGYTLICDEMKDADIAALVRRVGYAEGLPIVTDPGILSPKAFIDEVVLERLPNPFMPDNPGRINEDASQKVGIRFGETIKCYIEWKRDIEQLIGIPLAIAGWLRYLLAVDDKGGPMEVSNDPMKDTLQAALSGVIWNDPASHTGQIREILANPVIFGLDLTKTALARKIETMFGEMLEGAGAVRATLHKYVSRGEEV